MQSHLSIFDTIKAARSATLLAEHGLTIKTGIGFDAAILKLLKPAWTTDSADALINTNGLFFSIWVDAACEAKGIARYNLHARKLRLIKGADFPAREFARQFRNRAKSMLADWPNCSYPTGPITLFEGHVPLKPETLHAEASQLVDRFVELTPLLDQMLAE